MHKDNLLLILDFLTLLSLVLIHRFVVVRELMFDFLPLNRCFVDRCKTRREISSCKGIFRSFFSIFCQL